jgi:hypothetical protein
MAKYVLHDAGVVLNVIEADSAWIALRHPTADLLQDGVFVSPGMVRNGANSYAAAAPVVVVPKEVTMRQARLALRAAGKLAAVAAAIDAMPSPTKEDAQIEWEYSNTLRRDHPLVTALGPALNLTGEQLDGLFITAAAL